MKIDNSVLAAEVKAQRKIADSAIKFSERKLATIKADYLVSLMKRKEA